MRSALAPLILPLVLLTPLLLGGCGTREPAPRDRFYALQPQPAAPAATSAPVRATLLVSDLAARGFLGGRQIVYRTREQPLEVQRYDLLLWEEPPGRAIAGNLAAALRAAQLFEFVITPAQRSRADYILSGELARFEHLPTDGPPAVSADLTLTLLRGSDRRSVFSRRYQGREATQGQTPEALAQAFNRLAGQLIAQAVRDIQGLKPRLRPAPRS